MKKIFPLTALVLAIVTLLFPKISMAAGSFDEFVRLTPSSSSAPADNSSLITVSVFVYADWYVCPSGQISATNQWCIDNEGSSGILEEIGGSCGAVVTATGSGNTISPSRLTSDSSGHGSFTIKSSVAEAKTITVSSDGVSCGSGIDSQSVSVTFTAVAKKAAPTPVIKTTPTSTPTPQTAAPQPVTAPTASSVKVDGTTEDTSKPISVASNKPLVLSGKTVPNGVVTLTIHSTPKTVTTTADKDGNWSYSVTGLAPGSHYVEASVMDPATKQTSPTAKLLSFTVTAAKKAPVAIVTTPAKKASPLGLVLLVIVLLAAAAGGGWYWWTKIRKPKQAGVQTT